MAKKIKTEIIIPVVEVIKNEVIKSGPVEESQQIIPVVEVKQVGIGKTMKLRCDSCYVRTRCPKFTPGADCTLITDSGSVETAADMMKIMKELMKLQCQRISQGQIIEALDGGYPDGTLSAEMDRFFEMVRTMSELGDTRDSIEVRAKGKGIISQIFGNLKKKE